jgi:predicted site-specific integrase-resolvase
MKRRPGSRWPEFGEEEVRRGNGPHRGATGVALDNRPQGHAGTLHLPGVLEEHGCELLVLNQEQLSPEQEMVQDLLTIVHCFSARLYGLRNYRKKRDEALKSDLQH